MPLSVGARLGPYEILALLGAGGMGEVYRARDSRLDRVVAVKVLPSSVCTDNDRLVRFEQEARAAAALNDPHILAVYDVGRDDGAPFIVSELLEGATLRDRMSPGALPPRKAIDYATQMARGLAAAHGRGIVHRDLKPENVFITSNGLVKILDFGLAKLTEVDPPVDGAPPSGLTAVATVAPDTTPGLVLGTVGYMAPEQVRGLPADHRADIFAFGAILYEMLSGRRAFAGATAADTMTAILTEDPPDLPGSGHHLPAAVGRIVDRCLEKHPASRFQSAGDLAFALEALSNASQSTAALVGSVSPRIIRERIAWAVAAALAIGVAALGVREFSRPLPPAPPSFTSTILPPDGWDIGGVGGANAPPARMAISPDGRRLAFVASSDKSRRLWVRPLDSSAARSLDGTEGAILPFWSADSRLLGFFADGKIKKIDPAGGAATAICDAPQVSGPPTGAAWNQHGTILFSVTGKGLFRVSADGGAPVAVTKSDGGVDHLPSFLPDGEHFLFRRAIPGGNRSGLNANVIHLGSLTSSETRPLFRDVSQAFYSRGHLLFVQNSRLMAQAFDIHTFATSGDPFLVAEDVLTGTGGGSGFAVSENGVLVFQTGDVLLSSRLAWVDRGGKTIEVLGEEERWGDLQISGDGKRIAVIAGGTAQNDGVDIWVFERGLRTKFTHDNAIDMAPVWSPDDQQIAFSSNRLAGSLELFIKSSANIGNEDILLADGSDKYPLSFSPDGKFLLYQVTRPAPQDLWILPMSGDRKPFPFLATPANELSGQFSPNGRWIAYRSNQTGVNEVYVSPFPGPGKAERVSPNGGQNPKWRADGQELFYTTATDAIMSVDVDSSGSKLVVGRARQLFVAPFERRGQSWFDVAPDGQKFLVNLRGDRRAEPPPFTLVVNWLESVRQ
jgi:eukaryotic-like serine/threonine-protein kinase